MKNYQIVSMPKPLAFFITLVLLVVAIAIFSKYLTENPLPVSTGKSGYNVTLEDAAEKLYGEMND